MTENINTETFSDERFIAWHDIWKQRVGDLEAAQETMKKHNPVYIPRNHLVEKVLDEAISGNYENFHTFLEILTNPYTYRENSEIYMQGSKGFDETYQTFCGT